jgi:hypothetical protein
MTKLFLMFSVVGLLLYGCSDNKDQAAATGSGAGLEKQRQEDYDGQSPGFEKEQYRDDDANITTPIDSRPDLEEEE